MSEAYSGGRGALWEISPPPGTVKRWFSEGGGLALSPHLKEKFPGQIPEYAPGRCTLIFLKRQKSTIPKYK